jgi:hypothetical protein
LHILLKYALHFPAPANDIPLSAAVLIGGVPMVWELLKKLFKREFGSDLPAGVSMLTAIAPCEYLVATIVVLLLSGGDALEECGTAKASSVLDALARRMPNVAHRKETNGLADVKLADTRIGDELTAARDLPRGRRRARRPRHYGRGQPDGRAVRDFEDTGLAGDFRRGQRREGVGDPREETSGRFAVRANHERDARNGAAKSRNCADWETNWARGTRQLPWV